MKSLFLSFCLIILCIAPGWSNTDYSNETKEIFKQLDKVIAQKELYQQSLEKKGYSMETTTPTCQWLQTYQYMQTIGGRFLPAYTNRLCQQVR